MTDTVNVPLLPCPFCGSVLRIRKGVNPYGHCPTEGCYSNRAQIVCLDVPEQVAAWNNRAALAADPKAEPDWNYEGAMADLDSAITVLIRRINGEADLASAAEWVRLNYPSRASEIVAHPEAPKAEPVEADDFGDALLAFLFRHGLKVALDVSEIEALRQSAIRARPEAPKVEQEPTKWEFRIKGVKSGFLADWDECDGPDAHEGIISEDVVEYRALYTHPAPASDELLEAAEALSEILEAILQFAHTSYGARLTLDSKAQAKRDRAVAAIAKHKGLQS